MDPFPCFSDTFGTPNTSAKVATTSTSDTPTTNGKKVANFRTLIAPASNEADVVISLESILEVKERFEKSVYGFFLSGESMLDNRPWLIRNMPLVLRKWSPLVNVAKEDMNSVPFWVKFYDAPVTAFTEDGLSVIATKLGTLLMLDTYTTSMCMELWGLSSFARAMI
uniref:Uncharacterized protein n=1 Tax=Tanacetum cinerariifolium TaxID=118510 RepID=A0A699IE74_TANCI|nr:hypothetical protein [Tanacetum cinerariifolium]